MRKWEWLRGAYFGGKGNKGRKMWKGSQGGGGGRGGQQVPRSMRKKTPRQFLPRETGAKTESEPMNIKICRKGEQKFHVSYRSHSKGRRSESIVMLIPREVDLSSVGMVVQKISENAYLREWKPELVQKKTTGEI